MGKCKCGHGKNSHGPGSGGDRCWTIIQREKPVSMDEYSFGIGSGIYFYGCECENYEESFASILDKVRNNNNKNESEIDKNGPINKTESIDDAPDPTDFDYIGNTANNSTYWG